jgi:hypothetical protein
MARRHRQHASRLCSPEFAEFKIEGVFPSEYFVPVTELDEANDRLKL